MSIKEIFNKSCIERIMENCPINISTVHTYKYPGSNYRVELRELVLLD